jgi:DNA-binding response OmpR family regulator
VKVSIRRHIVVVDDERDIVAIVAELLRQEGFEPLPFTRPERALASVLAMRPALLVTDLVMPMMSGQRLITCVREVYGPTLPILVMSASVDLAAVAKLPVQAYVSKPFDLDDFVAVVRSLMESASDSDVAAYAGEHAVHGT